MEPVHHVHDVASFADFCRRNNIRYWIVDHERTMPTGLNEGEIQSHYWTDARTVAARGTLTIYDVDSPPDEPTDSCPAALDPPCSIKSPSDWKCSDCPDNWVPLNGDAATVTNVILAGADRRLGCAPIGRSGIDRRQPFPSPKDRCVPSNST